MTTAPIKLERIVPQRIEIGIQGVTPLICNKFSEKARTQMAESQQGKKARVREAKNPDELFEGAQYRLPDGSHGFPATGFKAAIVSAGRLFQGVTMTQLRQTVFVHGEGPDQLVRLLIDEEPVMREDPVRNASGVADLRYRPMYEKWGTTLSISFVEGVLSTESILALVDAAGIGGIGEWRPSGKSSNGDYGRFAIDGTLVVEGNEQ